MLSRRAVLQHALAFGSTSLLLSACAPTPATPGAAPLATSATAQPRRGGTLRIGRPGDIVPAGAPFLLTAANVHLFTLVYDTLVSYDMQLVAHPRLATHWEWSPDSR